MLHINQTHSLAQTHLSTSTKKADGRDRPGHHVVTTQFGDQLPIFFNAALTFSPS